MAEGNLFAQQESNRRRSRWLVGGFVVFFAWIGFGGDLALGLLTADNPPGSYHHLFPFVGLVTSLIASAICLSAWKKGAERVLWSAGAWEIVEPGTPEQRQYVNVVEEMAIAAGLPRPRIWLVPDDDPNAFATGRDPQHASIAVTQGLLERLSRDELQGVVAHEMAHVQNYDTRLMTLLAGMVGAILLLSDGAGRMLRGGSRIGGAGRAGGGGRKGGAGALGMIVLVVWLLTLVIAPVVTRVLAMAVSRKREYLADATGAQFTRNPAALASALEKLGSAEGATRAITRGAAHLCIVDPSERRLSEREGFLGDLLTSHPPLTQRIIRLRGMAFQQEKRAVEPA